MDNDKLIQEYLRLKKPHLYKIEQEVKKVIDDTGYGEVFVNCLIKDGKLHFYEVTGTHRTKVQG